MQPITVALRLASSADAQSIAELSRDAIEHGLGWSWQPARVAACIAHPETNVIVAGPPAHIAGFGIMIYRERHAHLQLFAVRADCRRRGVGSAMLHWLEDVARGAGLERITLEARRANVAAREFYNQHGWHERAIAKGMYRGVEDGVTLEKWLVSR